MNPCGPSFSPLSRPFSRRAFGAGSIALLIATTSLPSIARSAPSFTGIVIASVGLNLRTGPDTTCAIVRTLPYRTRLSIEETWGDWLRVQVLGSTGWVFSWYVSLTDTSPQELYS